MIIYLEINNAIFQRKKDRKKTKSEAKLKLMASDAGYGGVEKSLNQGSFIRGTILVLEIG